MIIFAFLLEALLAKRASENGQPEWNDIKLNLNGGRLHEMM